MAVTAATVAEWGQFATPTGSDLALFERVLAAVIEYVETTYYVSDPLTDRQEQAVIQQTLRLWKRRNSPDGIMAMDSYQPVTFAGLDKDLAWLLTPRWSFA